MAPILAQVCRLWRETVTSKHYFWTKIAIIHDWETFLGVHHLSQKQILEEYDYCEPGIFCSGRHPMPLGHLRMHLNYSRGEPLEVFVRVSLPEELSRLHESVHTSLGGFVCRLLRIAETLRDLRSRIYEFNATFDSYVAATQFFEIFGARGDGRSDEFSNLRHIGINWDGTIAKFGSMPRIFQGPLFMFRNRSFMDSPPPRLVQSDPFPKLQRIILSGIPIMWSSFAPTQLRELRISKLHPQYRPSLADLSRILAANSDTLEKLSLSSVGSVSHAHHRAFYLPKLEVLELEYDDPEEYYELASTMVLPSLQGLAIRHVRTPVAAHPGPRPFGDNDVVSQELALQEVEVLRKTDGLFRHMSVNWNFRGLGILQLIDVQFLPHSEQLDTPRAYFDKVYRENQWRWDPLYEQYDTQVNTGMLQNWGYWTGDSPIGFWQQLDNLQILELIRPDLSTLFSINFPFPVLRHLDRDDLSPSRRYQTGDDEMKLKFQVPLAYLQELYLSGVHEEDLEPFFTERRKVMDRVCEVNMMRLADEEYHKRAAKANPAMHCACCCPEELPLITLQTESIPLPMSLQAAAASISQNIIYE